MVAARKPQSHGGCAPEHLDKPREIPALTPEHLAHILDTKQYGTIGTVRDGIDALERLATDLDRYGLTAFAESIAHVVRQMSSCVDADAESIREADEEREKAEEKAEALEDQLEKANDRIRALKHIVDEYRSAE